MEVKDLSSLSLFPLCLHTDPATKYSYISNPVLTRDNEADKIKFYLRCQTGKEKTEIFYAIIPAYVPIPIGTIVFTAENSYTTPKYTKNIRYQRDPNTVLLENKVSFIAWTRIIPFTVPLYIHQHKDTSKRERNDLRDEKIYPSFDKDHPDFGIEEDWSQALFSPIYVVPEKVSLKNGKIISGHELGFSCYHGARCILDPLGENLLDCLLKCSQTKPENIFQYIQSNFLNKKIKKEYHRPNIQTMIQKLPLWILMISLVLFFLTLLVVIRRSL